MPEAPDPNVMTVEELFKLLSYGELFAHTTAVDGTGGIRKDQQNRIIAFANEGLQRLHARFRLQTLTETVTQTTEAVEHDFPETGLQVFSIRDDETNTSLMFTNVPIEDEIYVYGRKLHLPALDAGSESRDLTVVYYARHAILTGISVPTDLEQEITLVPELREALTAYVAQKMFGGMLSQDAQLAAQMHRARYEQVCTEVAGQGLLTGELETLQKLDFRGFV